MNKLEKLAQGDTKWLRKARIRAEADMTYHLLRDLADELSNIATPEYVFDDNWNEDAHVGKITLTIKDARRIYKLLGEDV